MAYGWTADKLDSAQNSTSITNYAVQVSGLHSGVTKKEIQQFFSDLFNPNKPGHLYDDGNRVVDGIEDVGSQRKLGSEAVIEGEHMDRRRVKEEGWPVNES